MDPLLLSLEEAGKLIGHTRSQMFELTRAQEQSAPSRAYSDREDWKTLHGAERST